MGLQKTLAPSMPRPIVFLDMLLCLPIAPATCPVPYRSRMLEDMLDQECWAEESDSELLEYLTLGSEEESEEPPTQCVQSMSSSRGSARSKKARTGGVVPNRS